MAFAKETCWNCLVYFCVRFVYKKKIKVENELERNVPGRLKKKAS